MTFEYDDKGKFFTDIIAKTPLDVLVQTTIHLIQGVIHIRKEERLKDELNRDELFLALTEAKILSTDGKVLHSNDFIAIHRDQIVWIIPDEKEEGSEEL